MIIDTHGCIHLRDAGPRDTADIVDVLSTAIASTSVARWAVSTAHARYRRLRPCLTAMITEQIMHRRVRVVDDAGRLTAAIVWTTCHPNSPPVLQPWTTLLDSDGDARRTRMLYTQLANRHPNKAHHHLLAIGVKPDQQQSGIGTALLNDCHHLLATDPADTFALAPDTLVDLALAAGYHTVGQPIIAIASGATLHLLQRTRTSSSTADVPTTAGLGGRQR